VGQSGKICRHRASVMSVIDLSILLEVLNRTVLAPRNKSL